METKDLMNLVVSGIRVLSSVFVAIVGAWVVVKVLLAKHDEKLDRIEKDIEEIKDERKQMHQDTREMVKLLNKVYSKVGVLEERTKNA